MRVEEEIELQNFAIYKNMITLARHIWKCMCHTQHTGWPKSKFATSNGYNSRNMHFWPYVGKAKMCFEGLSLFWFFSCLFTIFSCLFTIFQNKLRPFKRTLALPTWGQKSIFSELWSFEVANFDLGHSV